MKKALIAAGAVVLLLLTNPNLRAHQSAGAEKMFDLYYSTNPADRSDAVSMREASELKAMQEISRSNWGLFSLTEYTFSPNGHALPTKTVGIGILGQVYIWSLA